ncbi:MAG TPA: cytochrome c oxidase accessory protein CcoG [Ignavibacteria bacterium]|nr:cytochrome c oxidase accessory protein CcoG [Ignavibacteria bacterium]
MQTAVTNIEFRDKLSIIGEKGKRKWIYPKKPKGNFYKARTYVSWLLFAVLFGLPWIKIEGHPFVLLNIIERKFIIFGQPFGPQDFYLIVVFAIVSIVFLILFTIIYGRFFCGWICPQTIFLEMLFRKIEYLIDGDANQQRALAKKNWGFNKTFKRVFKYSIFFAISFIIANTFLSYVIGTDELIKIVTDNPSNHISGLIAIIMFSLAFFAVFSFIREQVCILACPYGRLQGVLLDPNSIVIAYDYVRGEPRGHMKRNETRDKGDCIDCHQCVDVCPTGIDIRNGTQLECVNCTACIDACNSIMNKVGFERDLIRYASANQLKDKSSFKFTARMIGYTTVLVLLIGVFTFLLLNREELDVLILRTPGMFFQEQPDNKISNVYDVKIYNKSFNDIPVEFRIDNPDVEMKLLSDNLVIPQQEHKDFKLLLIKNKSDIKSSTELLEIGVLSNGKVIDNIETSFMAPVSKRKSE